MRIELIFNILAISLVNQVICGNEGSRWIAADLAELNSAAAENDPYAKGFLALCHIHGDKGMNISMSDALTFARSSSDQNHWLGHFALGYLARFKPYGPDENLVSQFYLRTFQDPDAKMIKAYASGDPVASYAIAEIFSSDEVRPNLVPDLLFAAKHYQKASNGGYLPASVQFALFKLNAIVDPTGGVAEDFSHGIKLLRQATEKKLPVGYHYLGRSYFKGIGVEKDHEMALVNFRAAAARGYTISQLAVADFYAYGLTGQPKIDLAIRYAQLAMDQDEEKALAKIDEYQKLSQPTNADSIPSVQIHPMKTRLLYLPPHLQVEVNLHRLSLLDRFLLLPYLNHLPDFLLFMRKENLPPLWKFLNPLKLSKTRNRNLLPIRHHRQSLPFLNHFRSLVNLRVSFENWPKHITGDLGRQRTTPKPKNFFAPHLTREMPNPPDTWGSFFLPEKGWPETRRKPLNGFPWELIVEIL